MQLKYPLEVLAFLLKLILQVRRPALLAVLLHAKKPPYQHISDTTV
jgi:hypothetical protein